MHLLDWLREELHVNLRCTSMRANPERNEDKNTGDSILEALMLEERYRISFWDALILQAAERAGADVLYSEGSLMVRSKCGIHFYRGKRTILYHVHQLRAGFGSGSGAFRKFRTSRLIPIVLSSLHFRFPSEVTDERNSYAPILWLVDRGRDRCVPSFQRTHRRCLFL